MYIRMLPVVLNVSEKEKHIAANNAPKAPNARIEYKECVCVKPWGHEFLVYESQRIGIWYLKLNKGNSTSLHTHFHKDTIIIVMEGCANIRLIDGTNIPVNKLQSVRIPKHKFHGISSFSETVYIMEIEIFDSTATFSDKNDLLRLDDQYHRQKTGYESSVDVQRDNLDKYGHFSLDSLKGESMTLFETEISLSSFNQELAKNTYNILLSGELCIDGLYVKEGSLLPSESLTKHVDSSAPHQILSLKKTFHEEDQKIVYSKEHLEVLVKQLKGSGKKLVLTSGCYDILHVGHLAHLKAAKDSGDILMVCLSSDEQISALKGANRPINKYADRINLFKTISYVDYVLLYNEAHIEKEETLDELIRIVDPDIWTKGNDYTVDAILDKHPSLRKVLLFENVEGKSTTHIVNKINGK
jgi:rfaE bifunctional protein nucleotidyltransferase chain/domain